MANSSTEQYELPDVGDQSRPSLGFPLGTALLLIVIFSLSGIFSCCYHWDKLRNLRHRHQLPEVVPPSPDSKPMPPHMMMGKQEMKSESVTVIMAGDDIPKFIAMPCPRQPPLPNYHYPPPPPPPLMVLPNPNPPTPFHLPMYV